MSMASVVIDKILEWGDETKILQTAEFYHQLYDPGNEDYYCKKDQMESSTFHHNIVKVISTLGEWSEICVFIQDWQIGEYCLAVSS